MFKMATRKLMAFTLVIYGCLLLTVGTAQEDDVTELVRGNTRFALELYSELRETEGNIFYSPYSLSLALAMTYAGARGDTEKEMAEVLHFNLAQDRLHPAFRGLALELASRGEGARAQDSEGFSLNIVNALWGQEGYTFHVRVF